MRLNLSVFIALSAIGSPSIPHVAAQDRQVSENAPGYVVVLAINGLEKPLVLELKSDRTARWAAMQANKTWNPWHFPRHITIRRGGETFTIKAKKEFLLQPNDVMEFAVGSVF